MNNSTKFNAYCTLGHNVSVNIGLFTTLNYNEDEVAFVLGHELGHGEQHDPANGVKRTSPLRCWQPWPAARAICWKRWAPTCWPTWAVPNW